jgi:hypothetical protein
VDNPDPYVTRAAWAIACDIPTVANAAPTVPDDATLLTAMQTVFPFLVR